VLWCWLPRSSHTFPLKDGEDQVDIALVDLNKRRWVRFEMPVLVCVDVDENGERHVRHVVPVHDEIELAKDDLYNPIVYGPDGTEPVADTRRDRVAWDAFNHAGHTKDRWVGEQPSLDWDWWENPEDLTASDRYTQEDPDGDDYEDSDDEDSDDGELEWTPLR